MDKKIILSSKKISKSFSVEGKQNHILKNLDLDIYEGDYTVIMGASGAGKSTLLYALSGMDPISLGQIDFCGKDISHLSEDALAKFRRKHCGFLFQQVYLLEQMSLMDNVMAAGLLVTKDKKEIARRARELFAKVNISEDLQRKFPSQISGGEAQRAGIVRALISQPKVVFADEPTGALNSTNSTAVLDVMTQINKEGQSVVMVTHDLKSARRGNRVIYLKDGVICGECQLGEYVSGDQERHKRLNQFLSEMGW